jgi:hypothetical protein
LALLAAERRGADGRSPHSVDIIGLWGSAAGDDKSISKVYKALSDIPIFGAVLKAIVAKQGPADGRLEHVHEMAIDRVVTPRMGQKYSGIVKQQQYVVDTFQKPSQQYMHAMAGAGLSRSDAIDAANKFVKNNLIIAHSYYKDGVAAQERGDMKSSDRAMSLSALHAGRAIHTLQDATSPSHRGFQEWNDHDSGAQLKHVFAENQYPKGKNR